MQFHNIPYPVNLGTWQIGNGGNLMTAVYSEWEDSKNQPYAGGFALAVFNGASGTNNWRVWWIGPGQMALQATDSGLYLGINEDGWKNSVSLVHGHDYSNQQSNRTYGADGHFTVVNLGTGNISIQQNGRPFSFRYDSGQTKVDWDFYQITVIHGAVQQWETLSVGNGSNFPILVLSQSGVHLALANQDLAAGGYIASVAGTDFSNADLRGTKFSDLSSPSLAGCHFNGAQLSGAVLAKCQHLNGAVWSGADLSSTDLSGVDPAGTEGIDFSNTNLKSATLSMGSRRADYTKAHFAGAHLDGADLRNVDLTGADFTGATLTGALLDGANLAGATLSGADLTRASLHNTDFTGARLDGTKFEYCDVSTANLGVQPDFGRSASARTSFANATNVPVKVLGMNWSYVDLTGAHLTSIPADLSGLIAQHTLFPDLAPLASVKLANGQFQGAQLHYANLMHADLGGANLEGAFLKGAKLNDSNLSGASMKGTWLIAETNDPNKPESAQLGSAFLINTNLDGAHCDGADFTQVLFLTDSGLSPTPASAAGAYMNQCTFSGAVLIGVNLRGTQLSAGHFDNTTLIASIFSGCSLTPPPGKTNPVPTMRNADIRGTMFADSTQHGGTTNAANMDGLDMQGCTYSTADGSFENIYKDFSGNNVAIFVNYGPTVLGNTTNATTCPDGASGPCAFSKAASQRQ